MLSMLFKIGSMVCFISSLIVSIFAYILESKYLFVSASLSIIGSYIFIFLCSLISNNPLTELSPSMLRYILSALFPNSFIRSYRYLTVTTSLWFSSLYSGSFGRGIFYILLMLISRFDVISVVPSRFTSIFL